jgi:decaprenylphospho-beta-D-erythro-pentofuranosid-2-ulose 2-reductase
MRKILVIGATSAIAQATARLFAEAGDSLFLVARNADKLAVTADDLKVRGAHAVNVAALDVLDYDRHQAVIGAAIEGLDGLDVVLIAHGTLPDQTICEQSFELTRTEFEINALSTISLLTYLANYFEGRGEGTIVVISSVAGDRGRQSNYVYGSAKGAISIFLQGLRARLHKSGVHVLTIKPGFVDTPMTKHFAKSVFWASPDTIARNVFRGIHGKKTVVYAPYFWRGIMTVIKLVPERLFKRLSI